MLGAAGLGMKGRDESMGPGRGVRPGGPTLPRGTWVSGQVVSSAEARLLQRMQPAAMGKLCSFPTPLLGEKGKRAQVISRRAGTII